VRDGEYEDYGSVEGWLRVVSRYGSLLLLVDDPLWDLPVLCWAEDDVAEEILALSGRRAAVYGPIKYRRDGSPVSIRAEELVEFPPFDELPGYEQVRGIL